MSCPWREIPHTYFGDEWTVSAEDKAEINKWVREGGTVYRSRGKKVEDKEKICEMLVPVLQKLGVQRFNIFEIWY